MSTQNLKDWFWTLIKIFYYLILFVLVVIITIRFNLIPSFILTFLRDARDNYLIVRLLYYFLYSMPCLMADALSGLLGGTGGDGNGSLFTAGLLLLLLCLLLLPCIIRYLYLRTPWGMSQLMKTTHKMKLENGRKAIDSLEDTIEIRRLMAPGIRWTENWIVKAKNDHERNIMREELVKLGYRNKEESKGFSSKFKQLLFDIAECYITPAFPFYGIWNYYYNVKETLSTPKPELDKTLKYIEDNAEEMRIDVDLLTKLRRDYQELYEKFEQYEASFKTKQLINDPIYTDIETTNDDWYFENLKEGKVYNYSYAISCWIFIHNQPPGRAPYYKTYASIFNYGDKPNISYNMEKQNLRISMRNNVQKDRIIFETTEMPMQRWNNIVINYNGGTLDLYINNILVASEPGVIPYLSQDRITMGKENGLSGGICNVVYFPEALSRLKMSLFYETLKNFSPPTLPYCIFS